MDKDLVKLYQEYWDLETKVLPLRAEYSFLLSDIDNKRKDKDAIETVIKNIRKWVEDERAEFDLWRQQETLRIEEEKLVCDGRKNEQADKFRAENEQLEAEQKKLKDSLSVMQSEFDRTAQNNKALLQENARLKNENVEYAEHHSSQLAAIKDTSDLLDQKKKDVLALEKEVLSRELRLGQDTEKYLALKDDVDARTAAVNAMYLETMKRGEDIIMKENEINNKMQATEEKKADTEATYIKSKDLMQAIEEKELSINKKISEFQEEKFKFLVLMKQKGIKKSDIDDLEKDFNL